MILLDTHVFLWLQGMPTRLGHLCRALIERAPAVYVSAVSRVEVEVKTLTGRLVLPGGVFDDLPGQGFVELPFTHTHAAALPALPDSLSRHDPFDRMLLAQAATEGLTFVTADRRLLGLGVAVHDASR